MLFFTQPLFWVKPVHYLGIGITAVCYSMPKPGLYRSVENIQSPISC